MRNSYMNLRNCTLVFLALISMISLISLPGLASLSSENDPVGDVYYYYLDNEGMEQSTKTSIPYMDITYVGVEQMGEYLFLNLTVNGAIDSTQNVLYTANFTNGEITYYMSYSGSGGKTAIFDGDEIIRLEEPTLYGDSTITAQIRIRDPDFSGYQIIASSYRPHTNVTSEYYWTDYAPDSYWTGEGSQLELNYTYLAIAAVVIVAIAGVVYYYKVYAKKE